MKQYPMIPLTEISRPKQWHTLSRSELKESGYPVYGANGKIGFTDSYTHEKPTLLIGCRGSCGSLHITEPFSYVNGNAMALGDLDEQTIDLKFIYYFLSQRGFKDVITGTSQPQIIRQNLTRVLVPLIPLEEQRRIAAVLDKADSLREKRRQATDKLDTLLRAVFHNMFGDPVTNPKGWEQHTIEKLPIKVSDGNYSSKYPRAEEFVSEGVPFIRANNLKNMTVVAEDMRFITPAKHQGLRKGHLQRNDLLITTRGDIGNASLVPFEFEGANINAQLVLLRSTSEQINPYYLLWVFNDARMKRHMQSHQTGSALKQLPVGRLGKISLPVPSKELQRKFADVCVRAQPIKLRQLESEQKADSLFQSLQQRAFNGELFNSKAPSPVLPREL